MILRAKQLDAIGVELLSKIPQQAVRPFIWLGRFTTPALWMVAVLLVQYLVLTSGKFSLEAVLIMALLPLASVVKLFFRRERPATLFVANMRIKSYSFPSSHAYSATVAAGYFAAAVWPLSFAGAVALVTCPLVIGISRIRIGAHYPTDVVAGWLFGGVVVWLVLAFVG